MPSELRSFNRQPVKRSRTQNWKLAAGVCGGIKKKRRKENRFGLVGFYGLSTIVGYLMLNPFYTYALDISMIREHMLHIL